MSPRSNSKSPTERPLRTLESTGCSDRTRGDDDSRRRDDSVRLGRRVTRPRGCDAADEIEGCWTQPSSHRTTTRPCCNSSFRTRHWDRSSPITAERFGSSLPTGGDGGGRRSSGHHRRSRGGFGTQPPEYLRLADRTSGTVRAQHRDARRYWSKHVTRPTHGPTTRGRPDRLSQRILRVATTDDW